MPGAIAILRLASSGGFTESLTGFHPSLLFTASNEAVSGMLTEAQDGSQGVWLARARGGWVSAREEGVGDGEGAGRG